MTNNSEWRRNGGEPAGSGVHYVVWRTVEAIPLPGGAVHASGNAQPQVRSPERLAALGDLPAQIDHIQAVIVEALAGTLASMELSTQELRTRHDEITSLTLVAANAKLSASGVSLLDLQIAVLNVVPSP